MTAVRAGSTRRHLPAWIAWLFVSSQSRAERLYLAITAGLCLGLVVSYSLGRWLENAEQEQSRMLVAGGRDLRGGFVQPGSGPQLAATAPDLATQDASPAILPFWVQASRGAKLWSAASGGSPIGSLAQWQFMRVVGGEPRRFEVQPVSSEAPPAAGWVDVADVGISGPPPDWVVATRDATLYAGADSSDRVNTVPAGTALVIAGEGSADRMFVYYPVQVTSRRTGYGWVQTDSVSPTAPPTGVDLPSPQFRAVPKGRPGVYRVRMGDSVQALVTKFGIGRDDLFRLNGLDPTARLVVGQVLQVPSAGEAALAQAPGPRKTRETAPGWVGAERAVVIDAESGEILWAREANSPIAPASLTKIVTALVTLDHAALSDRVSVHVDSRRFTDSTVMGLYPGEELTVEDLLYGLMLPSGNDAALALAEHVSGTWEAFGELMNEKARSLGLTGSHFVNPHGLDANGHYSTPYDMAMLARAGLRDPTFRALSSAKMYETSRGKGYTLYNLNRLLWTYPGADGVKIGFTDAAGRAIVGSATKDGHRVIVAMMRSADIYADSAALLDWAFSAYSWDPE
jgi:D-alanyl-D-alanine carboxypeptidase